MHLYYPPFLQLTLYEMAIVPGKTQCLLPCGRSSGEFTGALNSRNGAGCIKPELDHFLTNSESPR